MLSEPEKNTVTNPLEALLEAAAERGAAKALAMLGTIRPLERVPVEKVSEYGAPSARWLRDNAPEGMIKGPRGGRYVLREELEALIASSTIYRPRKHTAADESGVHVVEDAKAAVAAMAAKRAGAR